MKYVADDGIEFDSEEKCKKYEQHIKNSKKSLAERVKIIIEEFKTKYEKIVLPDEYLIEREIESRLGSSPVREYQYGILFLRDDAVETLIDYIHELENRLEEKNNVTEKGKTNK